MGAGTKRNEPCECGSGKKHKYCCLNKGRKAFKWKEKKEPKGVT